MKKYLPILFLMLIIPSVTFASWWNPFTWSIFSWNRPSHIIQPQVPVATTTEKINTDDEISALRKEVEDLKASQQRATSSPVTTKKVVKTSTTPALTPKPVELPIPIPVVTSSASANPASQCLPTKKGWNTFAQALKNIGFISLIDSYYDSAFGTDNRPTEANARFAYDYTRLVNGKSLFYIQAAQVSSAISALPPLSYGTDDDLSIIKKGYMDALHHLENSYDFSLEAFKTFGDNPDNYISKTDIDASYALYKDAGDEYDAISPSLKTASNRLNQLQYEMQNGKVQGCNFTFYNDRTVRTTITDEDLFTQQLPKSNATSDGNTVVSISTSLPIQVSDNGQAKTVLKLVCNGQDLPTSHIDSATVGTTIGKSNSRHQCYFSYNGNGSELRTRVLDFNF